MIVYLDETEFGNGMFKGYASLIAESRISQNVIDEALTNLRADPDRLLPAHKAMDDRTLERGYFHAADDSKNAHSHLCASINKHINANFRSHIIHRGTHDFSRAEEVYDLASKLSVVGLFSKSPNLTFVFERRDGLSVQQLLEKWWPDLWTDLRQTAYAAPFIVKYYPSVAFEIADKLEPGIQVVDFILWASQRAQLGDEKWYSRVISWAKSTTTSDADEWSAYSVTKLKPESLSSERYGPHHYQPNNPEFTHDDFLFKVIVNVQKMINLAVCEFDRKYTEHFITELQFVVEHRLEERDASFIKIMADCFIKLFDNVCVISHETPDADKPFWLMARKCMGLALVDSLPGQMHLIRMFDVRAHMLRCDPKLFNEGCAGQDL